MKKITLLLLSVIGIFGINQIVFAASSILYVSPSSLNSTVGASSNISVKLDPVGNKICVVKGVLSFDKLSCQSISIASGLMAQTTPTCSSPSFTIGIPKCTTTVQNILSLSAKGTQVGQAAVSLTGVNIIGAGATVPFNTLNGAYNIAAAPVKVVVRDLTPTLTPVTNTTNNDIIKDSTTSTQPTTEGDSNLPASAGTTTTTSGWTYALYALFGLVIIYATIHIFYYMKKRKQQ